MSCVEKWSQKCCHMWSFAPVASRMRIWKREETEQLFVTCQYKLQTKPHDFFLGTQKISVCLVAAGGSSSSSSFEHIEADEVPTDKTLSVSDLRSIDFSKECPDQLNMSFAGCGFLGIYHLGVAKALQVNIFSVFAFWFFSTSNSSVTDSGVECFIEYFISDPWSRAAGQIRHVWRGFSWSVSCHIIGS